MKTIVRAAGNIGSFETIETIETGLRCYRNGSPEDYPFTVIGDYTISENPADAPAPFVDTAQLEEDARSERNRLLSESDWTQVADAPVDKAAWAAYRQALRNIPQQAGFPTSIIWPEKP
jgi:hypothetical protein